MTDRRLTESEIAALKARETELFKCFISICEKMDLTYYVLGGTLLGAVRHGGFIPWDDDIDVGMPRADYEKFLAGAQALLPDGLFLQTIFTDAGCTSPYAKIRDGSTTFIEASVAHVKMHHGVFIDVFPLDFFPSEARERRRFTLRWHLYDCRIAAEARAKRSVGQQVKRHLLKIASPSLRRALLRRDRHYKSVSEGSLIANLGGAWGEREIMPAEWYGTGTPLRFEGITVNAPTEYKKWLENVYGDYMRLPPPEKRVPHHDLAVFDLDRSYLAYMEEK